MSLSPPGWYEVLIVWVIFLMTNLLFEAMLRTYQRQPDWHNTLLSLSRVQWFLKLCVRNQRQSSDTLFLYYINRKSFKINKRVLKKQI